MASRREIWAADSETDPFKHGRVPDPFVWGICDHDDEYHEFNSTEEFVDYICDKDVIIYAHNGGKFDWIFLLDYIPDFEPLTVIAGRIAKVKIGMAELRDSYNLIPFPLAAYKKTAISYDIFEAGEREKPHNAKVISEYLEDDCRYLRQMVMGFVDIYGVHLTQASAALKIWAKMEGIKAPRTEKSYYADFAPYYYGGRVECFKTGLLNTAYSVVDIVSAYPRAMMDLHPYGEDYREHESIDPAWKPNELGRCFIRLTAQSLGALPFRSEDGGLSFPRDGETREFFITGWEYIAARDTNSLGTHSVISVRKFSETVSFKDYINRFYALKAEAGVMRVKTAGTPEYDYWAGQYIFAKIFLNALYGKFASNPEKYQEYIKAPADEIQQMKDYEGWSYADMTGDGSAIMSRPIDEEDQRFYNVAVSASITGWVRAYLWRAIHSAGDTMIYCDTDCIVAGDISGVELGDGLGQWELEGQFDFAAVAGKKTYAFRKLDGSFKTASKGARLTADEIIRVASGHTVTYHPDAPTFSVKKKPRFNSRKIKMTA